MSKFNIVKQAYEYATFSAYDYASVKRVLIDKIRSEFAEVFNDYTEYNELIMIINSFAYISELFAYRLDINAQEAFIQTAQIKENVIKLAEWIGYSPKRCIPARGLFKITNITPNFDFFDARGENLRNVNIVWSDTNNVFWKSQFNSIIQYIVNEQVLNADESKRVQINNTLIEQYTIDNFQTSYGTIAIKSNNGIVFDVVSSTVNQDGFIENHPRSSNKTSVYFLDSGTSDSSANTGYFVDCVQGNIKSSNITFSQVIPNNTYIITDTNINQFDVWLYEVNTDTFWDNTSNLYFNNSDRKKIFKIKTLTDNSIQLEFGDGDISEIPVGNFVVYYRTSINENTVIDKSNLSSIKVIIPILINDIKQTISCTLSCQSDLQTSASEDMQHIKRVASTQYQIQDRMVTEYDYKYFLQQDPRILCYNPIVRRRIGESTYFKWMQQDRNQFNQLVDDVTILMEPKILLDEYSNTTATNIATIIEDLLFLPPIMQAQSFLSGVNPSRTVFSKTIGSEHDILLQKLGATVSNTVPTFPFALSKSTISDTWIFNNRPRVNGLPVWEFEDIIIIDQVVASSNVTWKIYTKPYNMVLGKNGLSLLHDEMATLQQFTTHKLNTNYNNVLINSVANIFSSNTYTNDGIIIQNACNIVTKDVNSNGIPDILDIIKDPYNLCSKQYVLPTYIESGMYYVDIPSTNSPVVPFTKDIVSVKDTLNNAVSFEYTTQQYTPTRKIKVLTTDMSVTVNIKQYIFYKVENNNIVILPFSFDNFNSVVGMKDNHPTIKRACGKSDLLIKYGVNIPYYYTLNPEQTNLIQITIITTQMLTQYKKFVTNGIVYTPETSFDMDSKFGYLLTKRMFSDTVALLPGKIVSFIGNTSIDERRMEIQVKKNPKGFMLQTDIKKAIISIITNAFGVDFVLGETVHISQIIGLIMYSLANDVVDVQFVSKNPSTFNEPVLQVVGDTNELLYPHVDYSDIVFV